jgi:hypothetical protein
VDELQARDGGLVDLAAVRRGPRQLLRRARHEHRHHGGQPAGPAMRGHVAWGGTPAAWQQQPVSTRGGGAESVCAESLGSLVGFAPATTGTRPAVSRAELKRASEAIDFKRLRLSICVACR